MKLDSLLISSKTIASETIPADDDDYLMNDDVYHIGVGISDITGPAAEVNMMGYAKMGQNTGGIHFRLYSRAFIIVDSSGNRVVYVSADVGMIDQAIKLQVSEILESKYNGLYSTENVLLSGTHTHSGPGGFLQYLLYTVTSQGFIKQSFNAIVDGIVRSIDVAHEDIKPGYIYWNQGELLDASINRSPTAYLNNPLEERSKYTYNTDKEMLLLKFTDTNEKPLGVISWFAVHPTSMNNTNTLISGDNKGYASILFEQEMNEGQLPGKGPFVAAFSNANLGDVSPNLMGPKCMDTGLDCRLDTSSCGGKSGKCVAAGPGRDMFESTSIIGTRQFKKALDLFDTAKEKISGNISFIHQHIDMSQVSVSLPNNTTAKTCKPAMGYSFAAGTTDGPGAFDFTQGSTTSNTFWNLVRDFISKPSKSMIECHHPKPILLSTGQMNFPYAWQPTILPTQIIKIGNVALAGLPAEFTTMAGRRMRCRLEQELGPNCHVVLSGLSNAYSSYVTTFEEYQVQRYEGASTVYGPRTLEAYLQQYSSLARNLRRGTPVAPGPPPANLINKQISFKPGVIFDGAPFGKKMGDVLGAEPSQVGYYTGESVSVRFVSGHLRNGLRTDDTYLTVERLNEETDEWIIIATDSSLETKIFWRRTSSLLGQSEVTVVWDIPREAEAGLYRISHFGNSKNLFQQIRPYSGVSGVFKVLPSKVTLTHFLY